jgi:hypothetical protein
MLKQKSDRATPGEVLRDHMKQAERDLSNLIHGTNERSEAETAGVGAKVTHMTADDFLGVIAKLEDDAASLRRGIEAAKYDLIAQAIKERRFDLLDLSANAKAGIAANRFGRKVKRQAE